MVPRVSEPLLSSAEVAELLGVSPASIKRWADAGALALRQDRRSAPPLPSRSVDRFRSTQRAARLDDSSLAGRQARRLGRRLLADDGAGALEAHLLAARAELGSWWRIADRLGPALTELGDRWQRGAISVSDEHRASERFARAVARLCAWMPATDDAAALSSWRPRAATSTPSAFRSSSCACASAAGRRCGSATARRSTILPRRWRG